MFSSKLLQLPRSVVLDVFHPRVAPNSIDGLIVKCSAIPASELVSKFQIAPKVCRVLGERIARAKGYQEYARYGWLVGMIRRLVLIQRLP